MAARLEGIIELLVECLLLQPAPDSLRVELYCAAMGVLAAYCRTSDNNLRIVVRKHGLELLGPMLAFACKISSETGVTDMARKHCRKLAAATLLLGTYAFKNAAYVAVLLEDATFAAQVSKTAACFLMAPIVTKTSTALLCTLAGKGAARALWACNTPQLLWQAVTLYSNVGEASIPTITLPGTNTVSSPPPMAQWATQPTALQSKAVLKSATGALWILLSDPPSDVVHLSSLPPLTQDICTPLAARYLLPKAEATQLAALEQRNAALFSPATFSRYHPQTLPDAGDEQCAHQLALHLGEAAVPAPLPPGLLLTSSIGPHSASRGPGGVNLNATRVWALPTQYPHALPATLDAALGHAATAASMWSRQAVEAGTVQSVTSRGALPWYLTLPGAWKTLLLPHVGSPGSTPVAGGSDLSEEDATEARGSTQDMPEAGMDSMQAVLQGALAAAAVAHPRTLSAACNLGPGARPFPDSDATFVSKASAALSEAASAFVGSLCDLPAAQATTMDSAVGAGSSQPTEEDAVVEASPRSEASFTLPAIHVGDASPGGAGSAGASVVTTPPAPLTAPAGATAAHEANGEAALLASSMPASPLVSSIRGVQKLRSDRSGAALQAAAVPKLVPTVMTSPPTPGASASPSTGGGGERTPSRPSTAGSASTVVCTSDNRLPTPEALPYNSAAELWAHVPHWFPELQLAAVTDLMQRTHPDLAEANATNAQDATITAGLMSHMDILRVHFPHLAPDGWQPPVGTQTPTAAPWAWYMLRDSTCRAVMLPVQQQPASAAASGAVMATPLAPPSSGVQLQPLRPSAFPAAESRPCHPPHVFITPTGIAATRAWVVPASRLPSVLQAAPTAPLALEHMVPVALEQRQVIAQKLVLQAVSRIVCDMGLVGSVADVAQRRAKNAQALVFNVYGDATGAGKCKVTGLDAALPFAVPSAHWGAVCAAYATQIYDTELGGEVSPPLPQSQLAVPLIKGAAPPKAKGKKKTSKKKKKPPKPAVSAGGESGAEDASGAEGDEEEREVTAPDDEEDEEDEEDDEEDEEALEEDVQDQEDADDAGAVTATPDALRRATRTGGGMSPAMSPLALHSAHSELSPPLDSSGAHEGVSPGGSWAGSQPALQDIQRAAALQDTDEDTLARAMALDTQQPELQAGEREDSEDDAHVPPLAFESRFESGNLRCAARVGDREYELVLEPDTNTCRHTQWFYFAVSGMQCAPDDASLWSNVSPGPEYVFHLVNLEKTDSSYNHGMRPVVFFVKDGVEQAEIWDLWANHEGGAVAPPSTSLQDYTVLHSQRRLWLPPVPGSGWRRAAGGIVYYQNHYSKVKQMPLLSRAEVQSSDEGGAQDDLEGGEDEEDEDGDSDGAEGPTTTADGAAPVSRLYSETFRVVFPPGTKAAFFAYCFPYTYTDLGLDMQRWQWRAQRVSQGHEVGITDFAHPKDDWFSSAKDGPSGAQAASAADLHARQDGDNELCAYKHASRHTSAAMHSTLPQPALEQHGTLRPEGALFSSGILVRSVLCHSIAGNALPLMTITDFKQPTAPVLPSPAAPIPLANVPLHARPTIVLSARVHPGETNASWMIRGALDVLTSSAPIARQARARAVWKVVPFLNPDGVLNGHHRTNLAGVDLNRHWSTPSPAIAPTVWHLKRLLHTVQRRGRLVLYCDFHGHSRRKNVFTFGCEVTVASAGPAAAKEAEGWSAWVQKMFPALLAARADDFAMKNCSFKVQKSKANCARVAAWRDTPVVNSFTIEASFAGADEGANEGVHFSTRNFEEMGHHFVASLTDLMHFYNTVPTAGATAGVAPAAPIAPRALEALVSLPTAAAAAGAASAASCGEVPVPDTVAAATVRLEQPEALLGSMLRQSGVPATGLAAVGLAVPPVVDSGASSVDIDARRLCDTYGPHHSTWPYVLPVRSMDTAEISDAVQDVLSNSLSAYSETSSSEVPFPWNLALEPLRRAPPAAIAQLMQAIKAAPKKRQAAGGSAPGAAVRSLPPKAPAGSGGGDKTPSSGRRRSGLGQSRSAMNLRSPSLSMGSAATPRRSGDDLSSGGMAWVQELAAAGGSRVPAVAPVSRAASVAANLAKAAAAAAKKGPKKRLGAGKKRGVSAKSRGGAKATRGGSKKKVPLRRRKKATGE